MTDSGSRPGSRSICPDATAWASALMQAARAALIPRAMSCDSLADASRAAVGVNRQRLGKGVSSSARRSQRPRDRPDSSPPVPKCAGPGWRGPPSRSRRTHQELANPEVERPRLVMRGSAASEAAMASGRALKSNWLFSRVSTSGKTGTSDVASSTASAFRPAIGSTLIQP